MDHVDDSRLEQLLPLNALADRFDEVMKGPVRSYEVELVPYWGEGGIAFLLLQKMELVAVVAGGAMAKRLDAVRERFPDVARVRQAVAMLLLETLRVE